MAFPKSVFVAEAPEQWQQSPVWSVLVRPPSGLLSGSFSVQHTHPSQSSRALPRALLTARQHVAAAAPTALCRDRRSPSGSNGPGRNDALMPLIT